MAVRRTQAVQDISTLVGEIFAASVVNSRTQQVQKVTSAAEIVSKTVLSQAFYRARFEASFPFGSTISGGGGGNCTTNYRLRGWNTTTKQFEHWTGTSPLTPPPSLAALIEISYVEFEA